MRERNLMVICLALAALVITALACNAPTPTPSGPQAVQPSLTPYLAPTEPSGTDETRAASPDESETKTEPSKTPELVPGKETVLPRATDTPSTPSPTVPPTATSTPLPFAEPLVITGQGYEITDWQALPDSGEWEGHLRVTFTGGVPPYTFALEDKEPQGGNSLYIRWRKCVAAPLTVHVWSADGQEAHKSIWVVSPWCPD